MGQASREISYAQSAQSKSGQALIRIMENATGRIGLIRRARGYERDVAVGADFWSVMTARYGVSLDVVGGSLSNIPANGPVVTVANHPYGILDGLMMGKILSDARGDFRILANQVFEKAEEINRMVLPISFDQSRAAVAQNLETRKAALHYLRDGGAIGVFPGGTVSTSARPFGTARDPAWRRFTAKLVSKSRAAVVPIYFDGSNSRLFQLASHAHPTLRLALLINEFKRHTDKPVRVIIGDPIERAALDDRMHDPKAMMDFLRQSTYELSQSTRGPVPFGFDFDDNHKRAADGGRHL